MSDIIEAPDRVMLGIDDGESGYVLVYNGENSTLDRDYEPDQEVWDFIIMSDCGVVLGASDPGNTVNKDVQAGGPIYTPQNSDAIDAAKSLLSFLIDAGEKYELYDMAHARGDISDGDAVDSSGDPLPFNYEVRAWAYMNDSELSLISDDLE